MEKVEKELLKENVVYLGIDVSKGYSDFVLVNYNKQELEKCFQLDDNDKGHKKLEKLLGEFVNKHGVKMIYCGLESTGGYENNWYNYLIRLSENLAIKVSRINPQGVTANHKAKLSRNVTDGLSASYIADYMISHPEIIVFNTKQDGESERRIANYESLRSLYKYIQMLKKQKGQLSNQLHMIVYKSFPEIETYCKQGFPTWLLELLIRYPSPEKLLKAGINRIKKIRFITEDKAEKIIDKARNTVGRTDVCTEALIQSLSLELKHREDVIEEQKKVLEQGATGKEIDILVSMPGIGKYSAACIMIEIEDINRFSSAKKLASYFGLHPVYKQSGDGKYAFRMSKKGKAGMREVLFMVARAASIYDPHIKSIYQKQRKKGMKDLPAIGVCMHKILRIVYGMLKQHQNYNSEIDKNNMERLNSLPIDNTVKDFENKRRYQDIKDDAPVSNRNYKKRKALCESQSNNIIAENGIIDKVPAANI